MYSCIFFMTNGLEGSGYDHARTLPCAIGFTYSHAFDNDIYLDEEIP